MADRTLLLKLVSDVGTIQKDTRSMQSGLSSLGNTVKSLGAGLGIGIGMSVAVDAMGAAIDAASDLAEQTSKVGVIFGESGDDVQAWARDLDSSFGLSERAALEMVGTIGNLTTAMGLSQPKAAEMSQALAELAGDLASFNNADVQEVMTALQSGLVGEAEPMRRLGVQLSAAAVDAEALASGLVKSKSQMTEAVKIQARYQLIMKQTTAAQGDAARTADSYAGKQRALAASMEDLQASMGKILLEVAQPFLGFLGNLVDAIDGPSGAQQSVRDFIDEMHGLDQAMDDIVDSDAAARVAFRIQQATDDIKNSWTAIGEAGKAVLERMGPGLLIELQDVVGLSMQEINGMVTAAIAGTATLEQGWQRFINQVDSMVPSQLNASKSVADAWNAMGRAVGGNAEAIVASIGKIPIATEWAFQDVFQTMSGAKGEWQAAWKRMAEWAKDPFRPAAFEKWMNRHVRMALREAKDPENTKAVRRNWRLIGQAMKDPINRARVAAGEDLDAIVADIITARRNLARLIAAIAASRKAGWTPLGSPGGGGARSASAAMFSTASLSTAGLSAGGLAYGGTTPIGAAPAPSITINVQGGLADPAGAGRAIVKAIRAYETREGATWRGGTGAIRAR